MDISCYSTKSVVEIIMAIAMILFIAMLFHNRMPKIIKNKEDENNKKIDDSTTINNDYKISGNGIGARIIQFACVLLIIPCLVILGLEKVLQGETIATIIGGLIGYTLSGIGDYDSKRNGDNRSRKS